MWDETDQRLGAETIKELLSIEVEHEFFSLDLLERLDDLAWQDKSLIESLSRRIALARSLWTAGKIPITTLAHIYREEPNFRPLLYAIAAGCLRTPNDVSTRPPPGDQVGRLIEGLPACSLDWLPDDLPCTSAGVAVLRLLRYGGTGNAEIAALTGEPGLPIRLYLCQRLFESGYLPQEQQVKYLVGIRRSLGAQASEQAPWLQASLKAALDARKSGMSDRATWIQALRLPVDACEVLSKAV